MNLRKENEYCRDRSLRTGPKSGQKNPRVEGESGEEGNRGPPKLQKSKGGGERKKKKTWVWAGAGSRWDETPKCGWGRI